MQRLKKWSGQSPTSSISIKIDGVQARRDGDAVLSRAGKPLYNVPHKAMEHGKIYEVFAGSFTETIRIVRSQKPVDLPPGSLYEIWPDTDPRLRLPLGDPRLLFEQAIKAGHEGIVIDRMFKVKQLLTYDLVVTDVVPGSGKHAGRMGALQTARGRVGTGFSDGERSELWQPDDLIEVACMELTSEGMMRHPRFIRRRWDKPISESD